MPRPSKRPVRTARAQGKVRVYTLDVRLVSGPVAKAFARKNPVIMRTIEVRGDQTLADLHRGICAAFDRAEDHPYEFQMGPEGPRYGLAGRVSAGGGKPAGRVTDTTLDALGLRDGHQFTYRFDFGADWRHQLVVELIHREVPQGDYPREIGRTGASPPQVAGADQAKARGAVPITPSAAADVADLVGERHLREGAYEKAVEAFGRAIETNPTVDAYEGRARAYRELAARDEARARRLRQAPP